MSIRIIKILIPLILLATFAQAQRFPNTDSLKRYIDRYINNSAVNAFQNLRLNTALKGLAGSIDSIDAKVTGGVRVVDSIYKLNDTTLVFKIKGAAYQLPVGGGTGTAFSADYGLYKSGSALKVDSFKLSTLIALADSIAGVRATIEPKFNTVAILRTTVTTFIPGTYVSTKGFYAAFDGGGSRFLILTDTTGLHLALDTASLIKLNDGKFAKLDHQGTILLSQFGAKGDGTANDVYALRKANAFAYNDHNVSNVLGSRGAVYRLRYRSATAGPDEAFLRFNYSDVKWDGQGAKIIYDNDATQSYVKYTDGNGITGVYRCKQSHISTSTPPSKVLYFSVTDWQLMQDTVSSGIGYPAWAPATQYYGANCFAVLGYYYTAFPTPPTGKAQNFHFINWELTSGETDAHSLNAGFWNTQAKGFVSYENISGFTMDNVYMHNITSEGWYGAGGTGVNNLSVTRSYFDHMTEGLAVTGQLLASTNYMHDFAAHAIESSPFNYVQSYNDNEIFNSPTGLTLGAYGSGENYRGHVNVKGNFIHDCNIGLNTNHNGRGNIINGNTFTDNGTAAINIYGENSLFADASSDMIISENFIESYKISPYNGILFGNVNGTANTKTANIFVRNNTFQQSKISKIEGYNTRIGSSISFEGANFENIYIENNDDLFPSNTEFIHREPSASGVSLNLANNTKLGVTISNSLQAYSIEATNSLKSPSVTVSKDGSNTVGAGPIVTWQNAAGSRAFYEQLNQRNGLDVWRYDTVAAFKRSMTMENGGFVGYPSDMSDASLRDSSFATKRYVDTRDGVGTTRMQDSVAVLRALIGSGGGGGGGAETDPVWSGVASSVPRLNAMLNTFTDSMKIATTGGGIKVYNSGGVAYISPAASNAIQLTSPASVSLPGATYFNTGTQFFYPLQLSAYTGGTVRLATIGTDGVIGSTAQITNTNQLTNGSGFLTSIDTTNIATFAAKVRSLFSATGTGLAYNNATGLFTLTGGGGGSGVTQVTSGNLSNLATVSVSNQTTTPVFSFSMIQPTAHTFFGNNTGSTTNPAYFALTSGDLPTSASLAGSPTTTTQTFGDSTGKLATTAVVDKVYDSLKRYIDGGTPYTVTHRGGGAQLVYQADSSKIVFRDLGVLFGPIQIGYSTGVGGDTLIQFSWGHSRGTPTFVMSGGGTSPSITVTGDDVGGVIDIVTGSSGSFGILTGTLTFAAAYSVAPPALVTSGSSSVASLQLYGFATTTALNIGTGITLGASSTYKIMYYLKQ